MDRDEIMEFFRNDFFDEIEGEFSDCDRYEIMIALCSNSDDLEQKIKQVIEQHENDISAKDQWIHDYITIIKKTKEI